MNKNKGELVGPQGKEWWDRRGPPWRANCHPQILSPEGRIRKSCLSGVVSCHGNHHVRPQLLGRHGNDIFPGAIGLALRTLMVSGWWFVVRGGGGTLLNYSE